MTAKTSNNERELLLAIADGDEKAFAQLYQQYYNQLSGFLQKFSLSEATAKDILQEAFLRVWLNRDKLPGIDNFSAWLYKVVSTENLTHFRKELRAKTKISNYMQAMELQEPPLQHSTSAEFRKLKH
ncbi:sigma-70 family RNA polymerase sigma factor [Niabella sp. W65]|nr:sigma-70 family RNA polymerase sigma factor [Niabella sp. W65]MCH7365135.1 sigma-70 family RNA polymerase sigma factor [Niabella sp. W65]ULT40952.1 sigma-70 family RNA polymerase sigma factor [Niabella sp. I65]